MSASPPDPAEDRIRSAKDTGLTNLPLHDFAQNQIWCAVVALACELLAWLQMLAVAIVIVTHNLQQARRVGDFTAFLTSEPDGDGALVGRLVEFGTTDQIFSRPADERTDDYVNGRFG